MTGQPDIEIVQHAWHYWRLWSYSASSLFQWPPKCEVSVLVCCTSEDPKAERWLNYFAEHPDRPANVVFHAMWMRKENLLRRAIGRNRLAKGAEARVAVWFTDADYLFGEGCLDAVAELAGANDLSFPRYVWKCPHEEGDQLIDEATELGVRDINPSMYTQRYRLRRAVGGAQIVRTDVAREKGYLPDDHRFLKPAGRWMKTNDDVCARRHMVAHRGVAIDAPNVFRIRHSRYGRSHVGVEN